jgi:hypothetical protein
LNPHHRPHSAAESSHARTIGNIHRARELFLAALSRGISITGAAIEAGIPKRTVYGWRDQDEDFRQERDDALDAGNDVLEDEAFRRACQGVDEPVIAQGRLVKNDDGSVFTIKKYSDTLMSLLLKGRRGEKYRDRVEQKLVGDKDNPIAIENVTARELVTSRIAGLSARIGTESSS